MSLKTPSKKRVRARKLPGPLDNMHILSRDNCPFLRRCEERLGAKRVDVQQPAKPESPRDRVKRYLVQNRFNGENMNGPEQQLDANEYLSLGNGGYLRVPVGEGALGKGSSAGRFHVAQREDN